jgi:uncharacterized ferredoxin-like protein
MTSDVVAMEVTVEDWRAPSARFENVTELSSARFYERDARAWNHRESS